MKGCLEAPTGALGWGACRRTGNKDGGHPALSVMMTRSQPD